MPRVQASKVLVIAAAAWLSAASPAPLSAQPAPIPTFAVNVRQLPTDDAPGGPTNPAISSAGSVVVYEADEEADVFFVTTDGRNHGALTQVSSGRCQNPKPDRDGNRVAMVCSADVTGQNRDGSDEIVLLRGNEFVPITVSGIATSNLPFSLSISSDGQSVVFGSNGNYTDENADGSSEVFLWRDGQALTQVTSSGSTNHAFWPFGVSGDGRFITILDFVILDEDTADDVMVYRYDVRTGETQPWTSDVGFAQCGGLVLEVSRDTTLLVFTTFSCDSENEARDRKLYRQRIGEDPRFLLDVPDGWDVELAVNGDGSSIAVVQVDESSNPPVTGDRALFTSSGRQDLPGVPIDAYFLDFDEVGKNLVFISNTNLTGENPGHDQQLFVAAIPLSSDTPLPTFTPPPSPIRTATPPRPTPTLGPCYGDCNSDGVVAVNELVTGVRIALGQVDWQTCVRMDTDGDGAVGVNELVGAVGAALGGCTG